MDDDESPRMWLTTHEVANQLRIPEPTIRKHCRKGQLLGAVRIGKTWRIPRLRRKADGSLLAFAHYFAHGLCHVRSSPVSACV